MDRKILGVGFGALLVWTAVYCRPMAQAQQQPLVQRWEYTLIDNATIEVMNKLGREGWDAVGSYAGQSGPANKTIIFKRPIR